jgi:hypothetical protein
MILDFDDNRAHVGIVIALKRWSSVRIRTSEELKQMWRLKFIGIC